MGQVRIASSLTYLCRYEGSHDLKCRTISRSSGAICPTRNSRQNRRMEMILLVLARLVTSVQFGNPDDGRPLEDIWCLWPSNVFQYSSTGERQMSQLPRLIFHSPPFSLSDQQSVVQLNWGM